jgi:shikimate dehydrogenase
VAPLNISGSTQLVGIIGWPVSHTFSPAMHNAAAAELGFDLVYLPLAVHPNHLPSAIRGLLSLGFSGVNVTVPHKEKVIPLLDEIDPAAQAIGAVNTIVIRNSDSTRDMGPQARLAGFNTDWTGFRDDLKELGVGLKDRPCLVLGAGGSARAVTYALASSGARVTISARREEQAQGLAADLRPHLPNSQIRTRPWQELQNASAALIVNTTPVGMKPKPDASPWPAGSPLPAGAFIYDLVYNPRVTALIRQARAAGLRAASGEGMLLRQGAEAFYLWTGRRPNLSAMAHALSAAQSPLVP